MNLPERQSFEYFIENTDYHNEPEINSFFIEKETVIFGGRDLIVKDVKVTYYVYPISENSGYLLFYLGNDCFDSISELLDENTIKPIEKAWPKLIEALNNGIHDNDSRYALAKLKFSEKINYWAMYTRIENIELDDLNTDYVIGKVVQLLDFTIDMLNELRENEPSKWEIAKNGIVDGIKEGFKWFRIITGIGGVFSSTDFTDNN